MTCNARAFEQFILENSIKEYSNACDCVALARKVKCILELNTTNLIPRHNITSSFCTFSYQCIFLKQKHIKKQQRDIKV